MAKLQMFCGNCEMVDKPKTQPAGSGPLEAVLWVGSVILFVFTMLLAMISIEKYGQPIRNADVELVGQFGICALAGFIVSLIYSIARRACSRFVCRHCSSTNVMPLHTPVAQQKLREIEAEKSNAKYSEEYAAYRQQIRAEIGRAPAQ